MNPLLENGNICSYHGRRAVSKPGVVAVLILFCAGAAIVAGATNTLSYSGNVAVKETFDDNTFLQSVTPKAHESSFVTTITPQLGATWKPTGAINVNAAYSAGINFYHRPSDEDHVVHRGILNMGATFGETTLESLNAITGIDGSDVGPTWLGQGGSPAAGGIPVRDRRDAIVYRNSFRVTQQAGEWLVRPAFTFYGHDWGTQERSTPGYQNYVDRNEWTVGLDVGRKITPDLAAFIGYRYGEQDEAKLLNFPEECDSVFHRVLFGVEGKWTSWMKTCVSIGPEFREYADSVAKGFHDRSRVNLFVDATVTLTPTKCDSVMIGAKQFQQPGFAGRSAYDDLTYDFEWRHAFGKRWTGSIGTRAYNTRFLRPVKRNDWIVSPNFVVNCSISQHWNAECSVTHDLGFTGTRDAEGRDYERTLASVGLKYIWK